MGIALSSAVLVGVAVVIGFAGQATVAFHSKLARRARLLGESELGEFSRLKLEQPACVGSPGLLETTGFDR